MAERINTHEMFLSPGYTQVIIMPIQENSLFPTSHSHAYHMAIIAVNFAFYSLLFSCDSVQQYL